MLLLDHSGPGLCTFVLLLPDCISDCPDYLNSFMHVDAYVLVVCLLQVGEQVCLQYLEQGWVNGIQLKHRAQYDVYIYHRYFEFAARLRCSLGRIIVLLRLSFLLALFSLFLDVILMQILYVFVYVCGC